MYGQLVDTWMHVPSVQTITKLLRHYSKQMLAPQAVALAQRVVEHSGAVVNFDFTPCDSRQLACPKQRRNKCLGGATNDQSV